MGLDWARNKKLGDLFEAAHGASQAMARNITQKSGDEMVRNVKRNTPIERFMKSLSQPYHLRERIEKKQMQVYLGHGFVDMYMTGAYTNVEYAPYVEEGTGLWGPSGAKYIIRPKNPGGWLSWITRTGFVRKDGTRVAPGTRVFAKEVLHPGSPGAHMFAYGAAITEHEFPQFARRELDQFETAIRRRMV